MLLWLTAHGNASIWAHPFKFESLPMCCTIFLQENRIP